MSRRAGISDAFSVMAFHEISRPLARERSRKGDDALDFENARRRKHLTGFWRIAALDLKFGPFFSSSRSMSILPNCPEARRAQQWLLRQQGQRHNRDMLAQHRRRRHSCGLRQTNTRSITGDAK
jgi:hypothetical protein